MSTTSELTRPRQRESKSIDAEARLREIDKIVHTPTPSGMRADRHFQLDFDRIRALTRPWHVG